VPQMRRQIPAAVAQHLRLPNVAEILNPRRPLAKQKTDPIDPSLLLRVNGDWRQNETNSENDRELDQPHWASRFRAYDHLITWSARISNVCGIVSPSALAVLRLITSSNFIGCSTGRSAGLAPLRILST
jgi:hypothetical protein